MVEFLEAGMAVLVMEGEFEGARRTERLRVLLEKKWRHLQRWPGVSHGVG